MDFQNKNKNWKYYCTELGWGIMRHSEKLKMFETISSLVLKFWFDTPDLWEKINKGGYFNGLEFFAKGAKWKNNVD